MMLIQGLKNLAICCCLAVCLAGLVSIVVRAQTKTPAEGQKKTEPAPPASGESKEKSKAQEKEKPAPTKGTKDQPVPGSKPQDQAAPRPAATPATQTENKSDDKQPQPTPTASPKPAGVAADNADKTSETPGTQVSPTPTPTPAPVEQSPPAPMATATPQTTMPQPAPEVRPTPERSYEPAGPDTREAPASLRHELDKLAQSFTFWKIILSLLVLTLGYLVNRVIALAAARLGRQKSSQAERLRRMIPFVSFGLWFFVVAVITGIFVQSMLATVALMAIVIFAAGIASQPLLRDLIAGIIILFERPFQIGDRVTLGGHRGEVKIIGLRSFFLSSGDGSLVTIPNSEVLRQPIINASHGRVEGLVVTELQLPVGFDVTEAKRIAFEAAAVSPYTAIHHPIEVSLDEGRSGNGGPRLFVRAHVFDVQYEREARSDTIERAQEAFNKLRPASDEKK